MRAVNGGGMSVAKALPCPVKPWLLHRVGAIMLLRAVSFFAGAVVLLWTSGSHAQWDFLPDFFQIKKRTIEWRVENPFRLFTDPADTARHRAAYKSLNMLQRAKPIQSAEKLLQAEAGRLGWAQKVYGKTCYDQVNDRYDACRDYVLPKSHRVVVRLKNYPANDDTCRFELFGAGRKRLKAFEALCHKEQRLDIPYPAGATLEVKQSGQKIASKKIAVEDILIVGLGDSIGSGEGNPDWPVSFNDLRTINYGRIFLARDGLTLAALKQVELSGYPRRAGRWGRLFEGDFDANRAKWLDLECHRSLYSYQARVALQLAVENDHRAVTFLSFACTGADTLEGVFLGAPVRECTPGEPTAIPSQITAAVRELCAAPAPLTEAPGVIADLFTPIKQRSPRERRIAECPEGKLKRPIDLLLVSLGGNDVGFSEMVADAILDKNSFYRTLAVAVDSIHDTAKAEEKLKNLPRHYDALHLAFTHYFGLPVHKQSQVIITSYPRMGFAEDGETVCRGQTGMEVFPPFYADADRVEKTEAISDGIYRVLADKERQYGWALADEHREEFRRHGFCARANGRPSRDEAFGFPLNNNGRWQPYKPSEYRPYASRQRWVRSPNDAYMTTHFHRPSFGRANCVNLRPFVNNPFQLFLAGTYGGAFHPTAEGHAVMADAALKKAREILNSKTRADPVIPVSTSQD